MDELTFRKQPTHRTQSLKKESLPPSKSSDRNAQFCNRLGCSGRLKTNSPVPKTRTVEKIRTPGKPKPPRKGEGTMNRAPPLSPASLPSGFKLRRPYREGKEGRHGSSPAKLKWSKGGGSASSSPPPPPPSSSSSSSTSPARYSMKNLRCSLVSDVIPSNRRHHHAESSSTGRVKKTPNPIPEPSGVKGSFSDRRRAKGSTLNRGSATTITTTTTTSGGGGGGGSSSGSSSSSSRFRVFNQKNTRLHIGSAEPSGISATSSCSFPIRRSSRLVSRSSPSRDGQWHPHLDEAIMALDWIQQQDAGAYEHLLFMETNIWNNVLSLQDQHGEMRMDIDHMSYEELLELEDKMGTVSTALSEEAMIKCIHRWTFESGHVGKGPLNCEDVRCSICQEEYVGGNEVGELKCEHRYHFVCVQQWLRLKNWCPVCKAPAQH